MGHINPPADNPGEKTPGDRYLNVPLGVTMALLEIIMMVGISTLVKLASVDVSTVTVLLFRYALCLPLLVGTALWQRGRKAFSVAQHGVLALRIISGLASLSCLYAALSLMSLAKVTTLFQTTPLFITFLAPFLLGEKVGWRRWLAVLIGFGGVVVLVNPAGGNWATAGVLFGIGAPLFGAVMMIMLRKLGKVDSPVSTAIWYNGAGSILFAGLFFARGEVMPADFLYPILPGSDEFIGGASLLLLLVLIGVLSSFQQFFIAFSHRLAPASLLAPFRYLSVPIGILAGILFFGETLTPSIIIGSLIIICSSGFILLREK